MTYKGTELNLGLWKWCVGGNCIDVSEALKIAKTFTKACKDPFVQFYRSIFAITFLCEELPR